LGTMLFICDVNDMIEFFLFMSGASY
jgi:hypothetical protein